MSAVRPIGPVRIVGSRLVVRSLAPDDAPRIAAFHRDNAEHLRRWDPPRPAAFLTDEFWRERVALAEVERAHGTALRLLFEPLSFEEFQPIVGLCNFTQIVRGPFCACMLGYSVDHRCEGRGLMREGLELAIAHLFDVVELHRVQASYMPTNERSGALLERLGFVVEGYAREYLFIDGAWRDHRLTSKTRSRPLVP